MTSKEVMLAALEGRPTERLPVTPHWWGLYKFELAGMIDGYENEGIAWGTDARRLFEIDKAFYERFRPDMFHLTTAPNTRPADAKKKAEIDKLRVALAPMDNAALIDEYIALWSRSAEDVAQSGEFGHVGLCAAEYGEDVFIALNEGSDTACFFDSHIGFENGLIAALEQPDNTERMIRALYNNTFERVKALKEAGAHGFINSETYCSSDVMSPAMYRDIFFPAQKEFYQRVKELGLYTIAYFTGDIWKILDDIKGLELDGLMTEESKKTFSTDIGLLTSRIEGKMACFGNLDSHYVLEKGTVGDVERETLRQLDAAKGRPFIMANGCPLSFHTPPENIDKMLAVAKSYGR